MHKDNESWPFADPPNAATFTMRQITSRQEPILVVCHDDEDGSWQFLTGGIFKMEDAMLVGLKEIVRLDPSVSELWDLPPGWQASRASSAHPWMRSQVENKDA
jgi:hypothetical protein